MVVFHLSIVTVEVAVVKYTENSLVGFQYVRDVVFFILIFLFLLKCLNVVFSDDEINTARNLGLRGKHSIW